MRTPVDGKNIIVIGAGIGGLSTGILLSALEFNVTVIEKNPLPGGLMNSYRRGGMDCPVGVHYVGALGPDEPLGNMFRILGIDVETLFYRMGRPGVIDRYIFDNFTFDLPPGIDEYEKRLRAAFPSDAGVLDVILKNLRDIASKMLDPLFLLNQGDPFAAMEYFRPMGELLDELSASAGLRAVLAVPCQLIGVELYDCPVMFHSMVLAGYLFSSWRLKEAGAQMTDVFVSRFRDLQGELLLNRTVSRIRVENKKVTGVELSTGERMDADGVVAAIHPKILLGLLDKGTLRPALQERIRTLKETDGVLAVHAAVDAAAHPELDYNIYRLHADVGGHVEDGVFYQIRRGGRPDENLLSIITRSHIKDWLAWEGTQTGKRGEAYAEKKMALARDLLTRAEGVFGPLKNARILDVFTPLTLRDYVNCPEGSCYGLSRSASQLLKVATLNNISVDGLCLAGQNALAPGVLGSILGSFNAVRQMIGRERFSRFFPALL